jgi:hypothetical protein
VLEANAGHWNTQRGPRLERVIFRNDFGHSGGSPRQHFDVGARIRDLQTATGRVPSGSGP